MTRNRVLKCNASRYRYIVLGDYIVGIITEADLTSRDMIVRSVERLNAFQAEACTCLRYPERSFTLSGIGNVRVAIFRDNDRTRIFNSTTLASRSSLEYRELT